MPSGISNNPEKTNEKRRKSMEKANEKRRKSMEKHKKEYSKSLNERGHKPGCNCGVCKAKRGERSGKNNPQTGKPSWNAGLTKETDERVANQSSTLKNNVEAQENIKKGIRRALADPEKRKKRKKREKGIPNSKNSDNMKHLWQDPEYKEKQLKAIFKGLKLLPNRPEKFLIKLFQELFSDQWKYIGDGRDKDSFIAGKCPDFVHTNQKKIIEFNGDWWHGEKITERTKEEEEQQRINLFAQYGYQTLVIWEYELEDVPSLIKKFVIFTNSRKKL